MKNTKEVKKFKLHFTLFVMLVDALTVILTYYIMPIIQGFPPNSENIEFQKTVLPVIHIEQYLIAFAIGATIHIISFDILMKKIHKYMNKYYRHEKISYKEILDVRRRCINIPYQVSIIQLVLIVLIGIIFNFIMLASKLAILKFTLMIISIASVISVAMLIGSQRSLYKVIMTTYDYTHKYEKNLGYRITNSQNLLLQVTPFIAVVLIVISLIGYSKTVSQEGRTIANYYKAYLSSKNITPSQVNTQSLKNILKSIPLQSENDYYFIIPPHDKNIYVSKEGETLNNFILQYRNFFYDENTGMLYDKYESDEQLYALRLKDSSGETWYIGFKFPVIDVDLLVNYSEIILTVLIAFSILLYIWSKNISNNLIKTTNSLKEIVTANNISDNTILPITSNDEFADLAFYYNKIQELTKHNIEQIKNNQDLLIERERLASLGQMVGGIAHNLKTPIMSIAGADEGLTQLVAELDASIGNPMVTEEDYHAIAKDMQEWIDKIKAHTSYMSDVITAVKGQAVTLSDSQVFPFTVSELFKQVDILMKHELKSALVTLRITNTVPDKIKINGNINSLVQVLNNMISNSIQAYSGKSDEFIDLIANLRDNTTIEIIVKDYGPGLPKVVQENLFKQMVTTKGKAGTGLGLFMSYSNIKAHFHGDMNFKTEANKGTEFVITIPINRK